MIFLFVPPVLLFFFFNDTAPTEIYTLSLHDALPISFVFPGQGAQKVGMGRALAARFSICRDAFEEADAALGESKSAPRARSEEHTSELQSLTNLVCRLLLEKKKNQTTENPTPA